MRPLRLFWVVTILIGGWLALAPGAAGQTGSVILRVTKKDGNETTYSHTYAGGGSYRSGNATTCYAIEVLNGSTGSVTNVEIRWAILVHEIGGGQTKLIEGKRTTDLTHGQKFNCETDILELGSFYRSSYSSSRSARAEVVGYLVEVITGGNVMASDAKPADIRGKIAQARANPEPKRHSF